MHDSVLVIAVEEAKAEIAPLPHDGSSATLRNRIAALETEIDTLDAHAPKAAVVRLTLHALFLRDEAVNLRARHRITEHVLEMMD